MRDALVVVESPAKARTINKILGKDFKVMASMGHVRDLPKKELGIDVANGFKPTYRTIRDRNKFVTELRAAARSAGRLILATDPDREGEAIAWHVAEALKRVNDAQRVMFNEITEQAVREAVANPSGIDLRKVDAQQARRVLDRLVGYKVSPLLWKTVHGGLSAGRVQSVALRLICEREAAIEAFVPEEYWTVDAKVKREDTVPFRARLVRLKGEKLELKAREEVDRILLDLRAAASDPGYLVADVKRKEQRRNPAPPFITSTLQQEASRRLRFTARKTMQVAQQLYEGIEVRGGTQSETETTGLITYMRTDSTRIASDAVSSARGLYPGAVRGGVSAGPGKILPEGKGGAGCARGDTSHGHAAPSGGCPGATDCRSVEALSIDMGSVHRLSDVVGGFQSDGCGNPCGRV